MNDPSDDNVGQTDVKEVWFAGCHGGKRTSSLYNPEPHSRTRLSPRHADVGGGSTLNSTLHTLSNIPLRWMVREVAAAQCGIQFDSDALLRAHIPPTVFAHQGFPIETYLRPKGSAGAPLVVHTGLEAKEAEARGSGSDSSSVDSADSGAAMVDPNDDAMQPIHDQLRLDPAWWLLEVVPTDYAWQDGTGLWHRKWG